jgi:hypothetical protein
VALGTPALCAASIMDWIPFIELGRRLAGFFILVVLDTLLPNERLSFVLHDLFAVPFEEIALIVDRSPAAARQLASRARRRVQGLDAMSSRDRRRQREIVEAFLAASRRGDFESLIALLDPGAVLRADRAAVHAAAVNRDRGAPAPASEVRGASSVAGVLVGRATGAAIAPDVNNTVKRLLDVRKASFLPMERAVELTGMEYGGITPIGLPPDWALLVDSRIPGAGVVVIGSGIRRSKLLCQGELLARLPGARLVEGLAN